jgi:L-ascorbate metabolism protein UlaG (beta-lactamase superfamily)
MEGTRHVDTQPGEGNGHPRGNAEAIVFARRLRGMTSLGLVATYVGGPTAILDVAGLRFITDPTFDAAGTSYETSLYTLRKGGAPAVSPDSLGDVDTVLLSHDHHFDNLDRTGRAVLSLARRVFVPPAGAERLGAGATGLAAWQGVERDAPGGRRVRITATPARHGPPGGDRGPVIGFLLSDAERSNDPRAPSIYISGDTVWYEGVEEVARRADVRVAFLFMGAARVREVGPAHLTMTADEGVLAAHAMPDAVIVPLHYEGWAHFSEGRADIFRSFAVAGLADRLCWLEPGYATEIGGV